MKTIFSSILLLFLLGMACPPSLTGEKAPKPPFQEEPPTLDAGNAISDRTEVPIQFFVLLHTGEGNPVDCDVHESALKSCYGDVFSANPQAPTLPSTSPM